MRTEGAYRSAFGGISRFRLAEVYRYRIYSVISLCEADMPAVSGQWSAGDLVEVKREERREKRKCGFFRNREKAFN